MKKQKIKRGFASLSPERRKQIAALGGRSAHANGTAHEWSSEEAVKAGTKGGKKRAKLAKLAKKNK